MADSTLTALPAATTLTGSELVYGVQSGGDVKITAAQIQTFVLGNSFLQFSGPTTTAKTFALPDASATILTTNAAVTVPQGGTGAATLLAHGILLGNGTGAIAALAVGATGTLLAGATGADPAFSATPTLGANAGTGGALTLKGATSGSVAVQVAAAAGTGTVFQLPATNGTSGWVLQTDGAGVTSWVAAAGGSPAGASLTLQYNNASSFGGMSGTSWDDTNRSLTLTGATVTANKPIFVLSQTWNNAAVVFTALKATVTDTASDSTSLLMDLKVGTSSKFTVSKTGIISNANQIISIDGLLQSSDYRHTNGSALLAGTGSGNGSGLQLANSLQVSWSADGSYAGTQDVILKRDAAAILAQRNGVNAQTVRLYNTFTDASNYERMTLDWKTTANVCYVRNENAGTGSARIMVPVTGSTTVSGLPSASTAGAGARAFVTDATATTYLSTVAGTGSNKVPVVSDGTNWLIG